jgi:nucleotide-binding universal stress UspA family protein
MYSSILLSVAIDRENSDHAMLARDTALALAKGTGASIHLLTVTNSDAPVIDHLKPGAEEKVEAAMAEQRHEQDEQDLSEFAAPLISEGIEVATLLRHGNPKEAIVKVIDELGVDVLVIGSHCKLKLLDVVLGSTAQHLTAYASCPVILVSPEVPQATPESLSRVGIMRKTPI